MKLIALGGLALFNRATVTQGSSVEDEGSQSGLPLSQFSVQNTAKFEHFDNMRDSNYNSIEVSTAPIFGLRMKHKALIERASESCADEFTGFLHLNEQKVSDVLETIGYKICEKPPKKSTIDAKLIDEYTIVPKINCDFDRTSWYRLDCEYSLKSTPGAKFWASRMALGRKAVSLSSQGGATTFMKKLVGRSEKTEDSKYFKERLPCSAGTKPGYRAQQFAECRMLLQLFLLIEDESCRSDRQACRKQDEEVKNVSKRVRKSVSSKDEEIPDEAAEDSTEGDVSQNSVAADNTAVGASTDETNSSSDKDGFWTPLNIGLIAGGGGILLIGFAYALYKMMTPGDDASKESAKVHRRGAGSNQRTKPSKNDADESSLLNDETDSQPSDNDDIEYEQRPLQSAAGNRSSTKKSYKKSK